MNYTNKLAGYIGIGIIAITSFAYTERDLYANSFDNKIQEIPGISRLEKEVKDMCFLDQNKKHDSLKDPHRFRDPNDPRFKPKKPKWIPKELWPEFKIPNNGDIKY